MGFMVGGSLVSTVIVTRTLEPLTALVCVMVCEIAGVFLFGQAVVQLLSSKLFIVPLSHAIPLMPILLAALSGAVGWMFLMWRLSMPSSTGHAFVGGMVGAFVGGYGMQAVEWKIFLHLFVIIGIVPVLGFVGGYVLSFLGHRLGQFLTPAWGKPMRALQVVALAGAALAHGNNDAQKALAILALAVAAFTGHIPGALPWYAQLACGLMLAVGLLFGSRRIIQGLGQKLYRPPPLQAVCAQTTTCALLGACSIGGYPISSSQIMSTSLLGAGTAVHPQAVRWHLAGDIALGWLITLPGVALFSGTFAFLLRKIYVVS